MNSPERPPLFRIGVLATAIYSIFGACFLSCMGFVAPLGLFIAAAEEHGEEAVALTLFGFGMILVVLAILAFILFKLFLCGLAWRMNRVGIWGLIVVSAFSLPEFPMGTLVGVLTIVGCVQALDQLSTRSTV